MTVPRVLRAVALVIAVLAVLDPAVTSARRTDAVVAVVPGSDGDAALAERVARVLDRAFTVVRGPYPGAAGSVVAGAVLPAGADALGGRGFAVLPEGVRPGMTLERVALPARAPLDARVETGAVLHVRGGAGRRVDVVLRAGDAVLDRAAVEVPGDDARLHVPLTFVPAQAGAAALRVTARLAGGPAAERDAVVDVRDARWPVLFFDGRPSWMSTFVRRALEQDPRFLVTTRVVTSRGISTDFGDPPARLDDAASLALYDAIVVGAPETLGAADVATLERFMRRRGGAVVLLLDRPADGPFLRLAGVAGWSAAAGSGAARLGPRGAPDAGSGDGTQTPALRASALAWPPQLPAGARAVLTAAERADAPIVWASPVGGGRLVVSGALDAWRYRDPELSGFDGYWGALIAEVADASPPPIAVETDGVALPGEWTELRVTLRDAVLGDAAAGEVRTSASASLDDGGPTPIRLWPGGTIGELRGRVRAPDRPGAYRVEVVADGARAGATLIVAAERADAGTDERELVAAWAAARGGAALPAARLDELATTIRGTLRADRRRERWYPMRSAWWIVPFAAALGAEWWWRRRRGLA